MLATRTELPEKIANLDLSEILRCLVDRDGWSEEKAKRAIYHYRHFLALHLIHQGVLFAPSKEIDGAWHWHILNTRMYEKDCGLVFGELLHHHSPCTSCYGGCRVPKPYPDEAEKQEALGNAMRLFKETFGFLPRSYMEDDGT